MTTTGTALTPNTQKPDQASTRVAPYLVRREAAIAAIMSEVPCDRFQAVKTYTWIGNLIRKVRGSMYETIFLTEAQLNSAEYEMFDLLVPHGQPSEPGSTHELIERALLVAGHDEFSLRHDSLEDLDRTYCTVKVCLGVMRGK